jgi:23S rRNA (adenine2503-C2)-methyltransferase
MNILRNIEVPTGNILVVEGEHGKLECLSLGDYGKDVNLNQHKPVTHTDLLPLSEKWVCTISSQYGCSMGCLFCEVPRVGPGHNATYHDLCDQVRMVLALHPEVTQTNRLNVHVARMGEPTWNHDVLEFAHWLYCLPHTVHPVVSTMMPKHNTHLYEFMRAWMNIKNFLFDGNAGLQLSINSTNEHEREQMFNGNALTIQQIASCMTSFVPKGRKITLNFAVAGWEIDPDVLLRHFDPRDYVIKLTPMHKTSAAREHGIATAGDYTTHYPYLEDEQRLQAAGYDVLTFIASAEEDLSGITCGNAILSGSMPRTAYKELPV